MSLVESLDGRCWVTVEDVSTNSGQAQSNRRAGNPWGQELQDSQDENLHEICASGLEGFEKIMVTVGYRDLP